MSNPFYNYSGSFIPGTNARAEAVGLEFSSVQAGFALLSTTGVDTGSANTYIVTTGGAPTGAYVDGQAVEFKALTQNTGASTINVNSVGTVALARSNGVPLQAGDIIAGVWYTATYNSTQGGFAISNPVTQATVPGTISAAAPTNKVGLVAAGGVSTAAVPIDATYAIDQSIVPTWTGVHTFSAKPVMNAGLTVTGAAITSSAGLTVSAGSTILGSPTGGGQGTGTLNATGLFVNGVAVISGSAVTSIAGTANQIAASASTGAVTLSMPNNVIIPTPASGIALAVTTAASTNFAVNSIAGRANVSEHGNQIEFGHSNGAGYGSNNRRGSRVPGRPYLAFNREQGTSNTYTTRGIAGVVLQTDAAGAFSINRVTAVNTTNQSLTVALSMAATGAFTIAAPSSGAIPLSVNGAIGGGNYAAYVQGGTTSGDAGLKVQAGVSASGDALSISNAANLTSTCN